MNENKTPRPDYGISFDGRNGFVIHDEEVLQRTLRGFTITTVDIFTIAISGTLRPRYAQKHVVGTIPFVIELTVYGADADSSTMRRIDVLPLIKEYNTKFNAEYASSSFLDRADMILKYNHRIAEKRMKRNDEQPMSFWKRLIFLFNPN